MVEERVWKSPKAAEFERFAKRHADGFDQYAEEWFGRVEKAKTRLNLLNIPYPMSPELLEVLSEVIGDREADAEARMIVVSRLKKRIARDVKRMFSVDPSVAAIMRAVGARLARTDERIVEGLLGLALYLRALRAEGDPESHGGLTFDDAAGLTRYLESLTAA